MVLLELAGQSVRGMSPAVRAALKPGYLVLKPPSGEPASLGALLTALFFADGRGGDSSFLAPGQKAGKAGVTVLGNDQITYRVVRELGGPGALHKLDRATQKFALVTEDPAEIVQSLRASAGLPTRTSFEQLFTLSPAQLPSRRAAKPRPSGLIAPKAQLTAAQGPSAASDVVGASAKLKELERELALSKQIDQVQFKLDGISSQVFELE